MIRTCEVLLNNIVRFYQLFNVRLTLFNTILCRRHKACESLPALRLQPPERRGGIKRDVCCCSLHKTVNWGLQWENVSSMASII